MRRGSRIISREFFPDRLLASRSPPCTHTRAHFTYARTLVTLQRLDHSLHYVWTVHSSAPTSHTNNHFSHALSLSRCFSLRSLSHDRLTHTIDCPSHTIAIVSRELSHCLAVSLSTLSHMIDCRAPSPPCTYNPLTLFRFHSLTHTMLT